MDIRAVLSGLWLALVRATHAVPGAGEQAGSRRRVRRVPPRVRPGGRAGAGVAGSPPSPQAPCTRVVGVRLRVGLPRTPGARGDSGALRALCGCPPRPQPRIGARRSPGSGSRPVRPRRPAADARPRGGAVKRCVGWSADPPCQVWGGAWHGCVSEQCGRHRPHRCPCGETITADGIAKVNARIVHQALTSIRGDQQRPPRAAGPLVGHAPVYISPASNGTDSWITRCTDCTWQTASPTLREARELHANHRAGEVAGRSVTQEEPTPPGGTP